MKFSCSTKELKTALGKVKKAIPGRSTLPILSCVHVMADSESQTVAMSGTDLEVALGIQVGATVLEDGECLVMHSELLASLPGGKLKKDDMITLHLNGDQLQVDDGVVQKVLTTWDMEEYPPIAGFEITHEGIDMNWQIEKCLGFVSHEETRHFLNGCLVKNEGTMLYVVATDGRILKKTTQERNEGANFEIILPTQGMMILNQVFDGEYDMGIEYEDRKKSADPKNTEHELVPIRVMFRQDNLVLISRLIEGYYPDYMAVIDSARKREETASEITFNRAQMLELLRRFSFKKKRKHGETFPIVIDAFAEQDKLYLSYQPKNEKEQVATMPAEVSLDVRVGLNPAYLLTVLQSFTANCIDMNVAMPPKDAEGKRIAIHSLDPVLFHADGDTTIQMPMRITSDPDPVVEDLEAGSPLTVEEHKETMKSVEEVEAATEV